VSEQNERTPAERIRKAFEDVDAMTSEAIIARIAANPADDPEVLTMPHVLDRFLSLNPEYDKAGTTPRGRTLWGRV